MGLTSASKPRQQVKELRGRLLMVSAVVVLIFLSLMGRLYVLQVKRGEEFANMGKQTLSSLSASSTTVA